MYQGIHKCNVFIDNIDNANLRIESNRSKWRGEAHLLRAFYYLQLIKRFGPVMIVLHDDGNYDASTHVRPSFYENVQAIIQDCDLALAESELPWRSTTETDRGSMTKSVAWAIKSQAI
jgi:hypothetical protein